MRDISELDKEFDKFINNLTNKIIQAQNNSTNIMFQEVHDRIEIPQEARNISQFIRYESSIEKSEAKLSENEIKSSVFSKLLVGGNNPKWENVPVGAFLEWGTGPLGESTNDYPHGYSYTTDAPWDEHTANQWAEIGIWGIAARPHMYPGLLATKQFHILNIKEAIKEAWMK